ncbi:MAG: ATP-binding protein, partial [Dehalococcoidia bacterium]|nr:ATP-binding protein [Dehalococcoidia bacterium]
GVAHELNNPLTILAGHASILRQSATPDIVERADKISDAAKRCTRIVRNFLALARQRPPERDATALNQIVREAAELLAYQLRMDNVEVLFELADSLPILWADPHQLHQVVVNLVGNAHHALRNGSRPRRITIRTGYDVVAHRVALTIADNGPGIPPEIVDRIFEPFFTTKPPGEGTGLGLSLCRGIIASHGGTMRVEPAPGKGASFIIELPLGARPDARPEAQAAQSELAVEGKTILVVDDEAEIADLLSDILTREGHHVDKAPNGAIALEKLRTAQYDLVLSDIKMPEMDGPALYRALEQRYPGLTKRFIFISGDVLSGETAKFIESSGLPALNKPFVAPDVRAIIQRVLGAP